MASIALAIIVLPLISRATQEVLKLVPAVAARGEPGARRLQVADRAARRAADDDGRDHDRRRRSRSRATAGETAPILFTSTLFLNATSSDPQHAARDRAVQDLRLLGAARPEPARPGVGGGVRPDHVRARDQPDGALFPLPQPAQADRCGRRPRCSRASSRGAAASRVHKPFTTPSPAFSPHRGRAGSTLAANPTLQGEKENTHHMKRMLTTVAALLAVGCRRRRRCRARRATPTGSPAPAARFVSPLVSLWAADYASKTGTQIAYSPVGSGAGIAAITARQVDFGATDAPLTPDQFNACNGLRPDPVGAVGDVDHLQPAGRPEQPAHDRRRCSRTSTSARSRSGTTRRSRR